MGVNGTLDFEAQKSAYIHHKSYPFDSMGLKTAFCSKISIFIT